MHPHHLKKRLKTDTIQNRDFSFISRSFTHRMSFRHHFDESSDTTSSDLEEISLDAESTLGGLCSGDDESPTFNAGIAAEASRVWWSGMLGKAAGKNGLVPPKAEVRAAKGT